MKPAMREIARATALYFEMNVFDLRGPSRKAKFAWPRQIAMTLCRRMSSRSLPDIGQFFGDRDHTTVMHAIREVDEVSGTDDETMWALMAIAAEASGMSIDRQERERDWVQTLYLRQTLVMLPPAAQAPARPRVRPLTRVILLSYRPARAARRPVTMPSEFAPPSMARLMGARA